jgi:hypothetical protein
MHKKILLIAQEHNYAKEGGEGFLNNVRHNDDQFPCFGIIRGVELLRDIWEKIIIKLINNR